AKLLLDVEALRRLDVLQVDAAERGLQRGDDVHELVRVQLVQLDVEDVDAGELLEEDALALHDGLAGERADVAQAQHRGAVGDDGDEVGARRECARLVRVGGDLLAGGGDARRVGQGEVALGDERLGGGDLDLPGNRRSMVFERGLLDVVEHGGNSTAPGVK